MKEALYFEANYGTRRKRKALVKAVIAFLAEIRNAESKALLNTPDNFQNNESYEAGEFAVDALDEAIAILADVY